MAASWIRTPAVRGGRVAVVVDDDLFVAPLAGGPARRILAGTGAPLRPRFLADGGALVYDDVDGVRDVWEVDVEGGPPRRLTWGCATVLGVVSDGTARGAVLAASDQGRPFVRDTPAHLVAADAGPLVPLPLGPVAGVAFGPDRRVLVGRHADDLSRWRGYRGGRMGVLWLAVPVGPDPDPAHRFLPAAARWRRLELPYAAAHPTFARGRFYFVGDPDGRPQLCSVDPDGADPKVHTSFPDLAVRFPCGDGDALVFVHGGDLYRLGSDGAAEPIPLELRPQRDHRRTRPFQAAKFVDGVDLHPDGHSLHLAVRGSIVTMGHWEGPVTLRASAPGVRYRLPRAVDAERVLVVGDRGGEEHFELLGAAGTTTALPSLEHGRPIDAEVAPDARHVAFHDHRGALHLLDLEARTSRTIDLAAEPGFDLAWSRDGDWLAWSRTAERRLRQLFVLEVATGVVTRLSDGEWDDEAPSFDPDGNHLYFVSQRDYDPVQQTAGFGYALVRGSRPYCATLRRDLPHPFQPGPRPLKPPKAGTPDKVPLRIDLAGLAARVVAFPVPEGRYRACVGVGSGQVLVVRRPMAGMRAFSPFSGGTSGAEDSLHLWDFEKQELVELTSKIGEIRVDRKRDTLLVRSGDKVRVTFARPDKTQREELKKTDGRPDRKSGFVDLGRIRLEVEPEPEWRQMIHETWRLMRDHHWRPLDAPELAAFSATRDRYAGLVPRIATRSELSDLLTSLQGELGTSHAYEIGGDLRARGGRRTGGLGADVAWDEARAGWRVDRVLRGESGTARCSPLAAPGVGLGPGDVIRAVDGRATSPRIPLGAHLVDRADQPVALSIVAADGGAREVVVVPLADERELRYRDWVLGRRAVVEARGEARVGYVHVPDMGASGYGEFYRDYPRTLEADALLVDVRYNRGGHVSQLLLPLLAQRRIGRKVPRYGGARSYPLTAPAGPMALVTNEQAGSDGDIFTHAWRRLGLGPVFGTRTWGGVVGIRPRTRLVDRTLVTQPEYATWFEDVGYGIENHGAEPDTVIEVPPGETGDPQLEAALGWLVAQVRGPTPPA